MNFNRISVVFIFIFCLQSLFAQQKISLIIEDPNLEISESLYLFGYKYGQLELLDSVIVNNEIHNYTLLNKNYTGFALLTPSKYNYEKGINFILNPIENNFEIRIKMETFFKGEFYYINSVSNTLKQDIILSKSKFSSAFGELAMIKGNLLPNDPNYIQKKNALDKKYDSLYHFINIKLDSFNNEIGEEYKFIKEVFIPLTKMVTDYDVLPLKYESRKEMLQKHFFYFIDFSNELIYHNPNTIDAFEFYLSNAIPFNKEGYFQAVDYFYDISKDLGSQKKDFILRFLRNYFEVRNYNYVVDYFDEKTSSCYFQDKLAKKIDVQLEDIKLVNDAKLNIDFTGLLLEDINVVYIWIDWCEACKQKQEATNNTFSVLNKIGGVNSFSIEVDNSKGDKFPTSPIINLPSYAEYTVLEDSYILPYYQIFSTPAYLIIDKHGKLIYKTNNPIRLKEAVFSNL